MRIHNRHRCHDDGEEKTAEELLSDLIWLGALAVDQRRQQIELLQEIREGIKNLATPEQIAALKDAIDGVEATLTDEINEVKAAIEAAGGSGSDPALDEQIARLTTMKDAIEAIIPAAEEPPPTE